ncbi:hypothetical protein ACHAWC_004309 [Mediolabrus comicus]
MVTWHAKVAARRDFLAVHLARAWTDRVVAPIMQHLGLGPKREIIKYGVQARKICASCDDYTFPGSTCYNDFCGADVYGHSATHSGLLLVPVDDNGAPIQGILHGSLWYHGTEAATCSIPSEQYSDFVSGSFIANVLSTILFAGFGTVGIAPDGLGYGESYDHFKGYLVKKAYEASAVVLWSEARKVLSGMPGIELGCSAVVSGYSEGGYGAAAAPTGLQCIGVDVKRIQMGAAPFKMSSAQILLGHKNIQEERFPAEQAYYLALLGTPYSTFMPNALVPSPVKVLADNYTYNGIDYFIDDILSLTTEGNSSSQMNDLLPKYNGVQNDTIDPLRIANIAIDNFLDDALTAGDNDPCSSVIAGDQIFPFCETIKENDLSGFVEQLEAGTAGFGSWAVCHSPNTFIGDQTTSDALVFVENIPESIRSNQANQLDLQEVYLGCTEGIDCIKDVLPSATYIKTAPLSHQDAGARCVRAFANYLLTTEFSSFDSTSGSTTCRATSASSKSPTNAPTKAPSQSPSKSPITPNPSSSPTKSPSKSPSSSPTDDPSSSPTKSPSKSPSLSPTDDPSKSPTMSPPATNSPTSGPTSSPTKSPTATYVDKFICAKNDPGDTEVCSTGANVGGECTANGSECSCTKNGRCKTCFVASCSSSSPSPTQAPTPSGGEPPNASCPKCGDGSECCPAVGTCETSGKPTNRNCIPNRLRRA